MGGRVPAKLALAPALGCPEDGLGAAKGNSSFGGEGGISKMNASITTTLPHHRLRAYGTALRLLRAVRAAGIRDRTLRDQALRAAKSVCLNIAEGAGRVTRADKARAYAIARGELSEAVAAVEIACEVGDARAGSSALVREIGAELYAVLSKLVR
jgi:four helix bundle protein